MKALEWIFIWVIVPMIGGFIGAIIFRILKDKIGGKLWKEK